jgi:hypothetical protein
MAWDDTFVYKVSKVTSAQMNAIIAKIKSIFAEEIQFSDSTVGDVSTTKHGYFPKLPGGAGFWRADGLWAVTGAGDITGSTGTTDNAILLADGVGGATFKAAGVTIDGSDNIVTTGTIGGGAITGTSLVASTGGVNIPAGQTYKINNVPLAVGDITGAGAGTVTHSTGALTLAGVVVGNGSDDIKIATDIPTATTIGTAYVYRAGGTDVPYTDGGTGISTYPKRTLFLSGAGGVASTTAGCGAGDTFETATNDVNFRGTTFAAGATDISKEWGCIMPSNWDGGTVTAIPVFHTKAGTDAGNHTIIFNVAGVSFASGETLDTAYGTLQSSSYTVASSMAGKIIFGPETSAITVGGASPAGGEFVQWRVSREGDDTCTDSVYLLGVKITYQTNGTSDA